MLLWLRTVHVPALAAEILCTVSLAVWGESGPVIVRVEASPSAVHVAMRHGTPASLRHTGTGKVFAAYMSHDRLMAALRNESGESSAEDRDFIRELATIRAQGISTVRHELLSGVSAMAVPVFDAFGHLVMAIAAIGPSQLLDLTPDGQQAQALKKLGVAAQPSYRQEHKSMTTQNERADTALFSGHVILNGTTPYPGSPKRRTPKKRTRFTISSVLVPPDLAGSAWKSMSS